MLIYDSLSCETLIFIAVSAYILDLILGDPRWLPHPVIWMGNAVSFFEPIFRRVVKNEFVSGLLFSIFLITSTWIIADSAVKAASSINPAFGTAVQVLLLFFCLSARTLEKAAMEVYDAFLCVPGGKEKKERKENGVKKNGNASDLLKRAGDEAVSAELAAARHKVSMIVGREVKYLDETGVVKAAVETVAENFVDGFLSPLLFALIGGIPAAVAYKMVNTLDSMVGYRNDRYILFGRASARIDDIANLIPARLSVIIISFSASLLSLKRGLSAFKTSVCEGRKHKSPNSGYPEAAFSGALRVKLGGPNYYHGKLVKKPYIGAAFSDPGREKIKMACNLMLLSSLVTVALVGIVIFVKSSF